MAVAVGDIYLLSFRGEQFGQKLINTFHYRITAVAAGQSEAQGALSLITANRAGTGGSDNLETDFLACVPDSYTLRSIRSQKVYPIRVGYQQTLRATTGTSAEAASTANVCGVITRKGELASRREIGSLHVGGIDLGMQDSGDLSAVGLARFQALANRLPLLLTLATGSYSWQPVLFHRSGAGAFSPITQVEVQTTVRVLRRRTKGVGK